MQSAAVAMLPDGRRLHLHHGPIDLIVEAFGADTAYAYQRTSDRFASVLDELVSELENLRKPIRQNRVFDGVIARRMQKSASLFLPEFLTPMACVAGAVADTILSVLVDGQPFSKAYVNNGGDVAFYLNKGEHIEAAVAAEYPAGITINAHEPYRGIATSGWRGRSFSFGIADSVSVVAANATIADAAATLIANHVDLPNHPGITRTPAVSLSPDSDLGARRVTTDVGPLTLDETTSALNRGAEFAGMLVRTGNIGGAILTLNNQSRQTGDQFKTLQNK